MPKEFRLTKEGNQKVEAALEEFKIEPGNLSSFIKTLKEHNINLSMENDLSKIDPNLVAFIKFGSAQPKTSEVFIDRKVGKNDDFNLYFYLAHEVGHHMMHFVSGDVIPQCRKNNYLEEYHNLPEQEREAEVFAYNLLMPEQDFTKVYNIVNKFHDGDMDKILKDLSEYFFTGKKYVLQRIKYIKEHGYEPAR
jgi:hypothetical protein